MDLNHYVLNPPKISYSIEDFTILKIPLHVRGILHKIHKSQEMIVRHPNSSIPCPPNFHSFTNICSQLSSLSQISHRYSLETGHIPCIWKASPKPSPYILLYFHARGCDAGSCLSFAEYITKTLHINLLIFEYPGYGMRSEMMPSLSKVYEETTKIVHFLTETLGFNTESLIVCGRSIGCAPALYAATHCRVGGCILISAFTSLKEAAGSFFKGLQFLLREECDLRKWVQECKAPILFLHGDKDTTFGDQHSQELFDLCSSSIKQIKILKGSTHDSLDFEKVAAMINLFFKKHLTKDNWISGEDGQIDVPMYIKQYYKDLID